MKMPTFISPINQN